MSENKLLKRRLDIGSSEEKEASTKKHVNNVVKNPYLKKSSQTTTTAKTEEASAINTAAHATTITPETGIEKFFVPKRKAGEVKKPSHVVRTLVPPRFYKNTVIMLLQALMKMAIPLVVYITIPRMNLQESSKRQKYTNLITFTRV